MQLLTFAIYLNIVMFVHKYTTKVLKTDQFLNNNIIMIEKFRGYKFRV